MRWRAGFRPWTLIIWGVVVLLLYLVFRQVPLAQIKPIISRFHIAQAILILLMSLLFLFLANLRWWILLRSFGSSVSLLALSAYRQAGFGVSYFTPGPQFGGEPVQVHLLHLRKGVPLDRALSSVFLDRLVDVLSNFTFLAAGSLVLLVGGWFTIHLPARTWFFPFLLLLLPAGHLIALRLGALPASWLMNHITWPWVKRFRGLVFQSETQVAGLIIEKPVVVGMVLLLSALTWGVAISEFWLILRFLGIQAGLIESVAALTLMRFAFLVPVPGGLGALEGSMYLAAQALGWEPAAGIAVSLVVRARDILFALLGVGSGFLAYRSYLFPERKVVERR